VRILMTTGIFPPDIGGPATYVPAIAESLASRGHRVSVLALADAAAPVVRDAYPFIVHRVRRRQFLPLRFLRVFGTVLRLGRRADVIYANGLFLETALAARLLRKPLVMKIVGDKAWETAQRFGWTRDSFHEFQGGRRSWGVEALKAWRTAAPKMADRLIVPSAYLKRAVAAWGVRAEKITVIHNAAGEAAAVEQNPRGGLFHLVTIGRLIPLKRIDGVLRAAAALPNVRVTVIGDGPEKPALERLARSLNLDGRVVFTGALAPAQARRVLDESHALVLYSTHEGFPHVALEAMARGLPVIGTNAGGIPEVVWDGENGLLVPTDDETHLRRAVSTLMEYKPLWEVLSLGARRTPGFFPREKMIDETEKCLAAGGPVPAPAAVQ